MALVDHVNDEYYSPARTYHGMTKPASHHYFGKISLAVLAAGAVGISAFCAFI